FEGRVNALFAVVGERRNRGRGLLGRGFGRLRTTARNDLGGAGQGAGGILERGRSISLSSVYLNDVGLPVLARRPRLYVQIDILGIHQNLQSRESDWPEIQTRQC